MKLNLHKCNIYRLNAYIYKDALSLREENVVVATNPSIYLFLCYNTYMLIYSAVISEPDDVTVFEGREAVFTCVLNSNIRSDDVQWYRFIKDTSTTVMVDPDGDNIYFITDTIGNATSSSLTITNVIKSYTGYFWVGIPSLTVCNASLTVLTSMCVHIDYVLYIYVN